MVFVTVVTCVTVSFRFGTQRFALDSSLSAGLSVPLAQLGRGAERDSTPGTFPRIHGPPRWLPPVLRVPGWAHQVQSLQITGTSSDTFPLNLSQITRLQNVPALFIMSQWNYLPQIPLIASGAFTSFWHPPCLVAMNSPLASGM